MEQAKRREKEAAAAAAAAAAEAAAKEAQALKDAMAAQENADEMQDGRELTQMSLNRKKSIRDGKLINKRKYSLYSLYLAVKDGW